MAKRRPSSSRTRARAREGSQAELGDAVADSASSVGDFNAVASDDAASESSRAMDTDAMDTDAESMRGDDGGGADASGEGGSEGDAFAEVDDEDADIQSAMGESTMGESMVGESTVGESAVDESAVSEMDEEEQEESVIAESDLDITSDSALDDLEGGDGAWRSRSRWSRKHSTRNPASLNDANDSAEGVSFGDDELMRTARDDNSLPEMPSLLGEQESLPTLVDSGEGSNFLETRDFTDRGIKSVSPNMKIEACDKGLSAQPDLYVIVRMKLTGVTKPGEPTALDGAWAAAEAAREEAERQRNEAAAQAKAAAEAKAREEAERRRAELGEAAEYVVDRGKPARSIAPRQFWDKVDDHLAVPALGALPPPPVLPAPPPRCPLLNRLISALIPLPPDLRTLGGPTATKVEVTITKTEVQSVAEHGRGGDAASAPAHGTPSLLALVEDGSTNSIAHANALEASDRSVRRELSVLGLLHEGDEVLKYDPVGDRLRQMTRELHYLTRQNTLRCVVLRQRALAASKSEQARRLAAAAAARVKRRYARIRKAQRARKGGGSTKS